MKKYIFIITASILSVLSCIDPISFENSSNSEHLVIQAMFNNTVDTQLIRVSLSNKFGSPFNRFVSTAKVIITSLEGEKYDFIYTVSGKYISAKNVKPIAGHTYTLNVLYNGKTYVSVPVKTFEQNELVPINAINLTENTKSFIVEGLKDTQLLPGYDISVDLQDTPNKNNFYRWTYSRIYEVSAQPEDHMEHGCLTCPRPAPLPCCSTCYVNEHEELLSIGNDFLKNGNLIKNQLVMFMPFYQYLNKKMRLTIYQHHISEETYNYYKYLNAQSTSTGTMFDAPPAELKGNLYTPANKDEKVLGLFDVSIATEKTIIIKNTDINYKIPKFIYPDDCRVINNSTTEKPIGWD